MDLNKIAGLMSSILCKIRQIQTRYPVVRGMTTYAVIWPCSSLAQEYLEFGTPLHRCNMARALRYSIFGAFFMSPVFYTWLKLTGPFFQKKTLGTAIKRAAIEQFTYGPMAVSFFLFGMSLLEGKSIDTSVEEVKEKFWPVYKMGFFYWPTVQTINFRYISDKNRFLFVGVASFIYTCYLAHIQSNSERCH